MHAHEEPPASESSGTERTSNSPLSTGTEGVESVSRDMRQQFADVQGPKDKEKREDPEVLVKQYLRRYLRENVNTVDTLDELERVIKFMDDRLPYMVITKCIDGRVHGTRPKRLPPRSQRVSLMRTDGNKANVGLENSHFWNRVNEARMNARANTPGMPALFLALAHTSKLAGKCAAHKGDDQAAIQSAKEQADAVRTMQDKDVFAAYGVTNTDDMSHTFIFKGKDESEVTIDVSELIEEFKFTDASQVLDSEFLKEQVDDPILQIYTGDKPLGEYLEGINPVFFTDLKIATALEAYMLKRIHESFLSRGTGNNKVVNSALEAKILKTFDKIPGSEKLQPALMHMIVGNIMYALFKRQKIATMSEEQLELYLGHGEELICYGEGFQLHDRNKCLLVKPGRGNDREALSIARDVLSHGKVRVAQNHPPIVHINEEANDKPRSFKDIARLKGRLLTKANLVKEIFGSDVRILATYSTIDEKLFYPVQLGGNGVFVEMGDVSKNINSGSRARDIAGNESTYVNSTRSEQQQD